MGGSQSMEMSRELQEKFSILAKLDSDCCDYIGQLGPAVVKHVLMGAFLHMDLIHVDKMKKAFKFCDNSLSLSGSIGDRSAICRWFKNREQDEPIIDLEIDYMFEFATITSGDEESLLEPIPKQVGFYRVLSSENLSLNQIFQDVDILKALSFWDDQPTSQLEQVVQDFQATRKYLRSDLLRQVVALIVKNGNINNTRVETHGPSAENTFTYDKIFHDAMEGVEKFLNLSPISENSEKVSIRRFKAISLLKFFDANEQTNCTDGEYQLELFVKTFADTESNIIDEKAFGRFLTSIENVDVEDLTVLLDYGIERLNFIPYFEIKGLGNISIDNVACIRLPFWPEITSKWRKRWRWKREGHHWPKTEILDEINTLGCHIVPKDTQGGTGLDEWRISFSAVERCLMNSLTETQHRCYLVSKCIFYAKIKPINPEELASYYLKTTMLCMMETRKAEFWNENDLVIICAIYKQLADGLKQGKIETIFVEGLNILSNVRSSTLREASEAAYLISNNPKEFIPGNIDEVIEHGKVVVRLYGLVAKFCRNIASKIEASLDHEAGIEFLSQMIKKT